MFCFLCCFQTLEAHLLQLLFIFFNSYFLLLFSISFSFMLSAAFVFFYLILIYFICFVCSVALAFLICFVCCSVIQNSVLLCTALFISLVNACRHYYNDYGLVLKQGSYTFDWKSEISFEADCSRYL